MFKDHLATFVCPGFVVKFHNQNVTTVESHAPYLILAGRTLSQYLLLPLLLLYMLGDSPSLPLAFTTTAVAAAGLGLRFSLQESGKGHGTPLQ